MGQVLGSLLKPFVDEHAIRPPYVVPQHADLVHGDGRKANSVFVELSKESMFKPKGANRKLSESDGQG